MISIGRYISVLQDVVWKYNLVMLDRLILCLALRCYEGDNAKVCSFAV